MKHGAYVMMFEGSERSRESHFGPSANPTPSGFLLFWERRVMRQFAKLLSVLAILGLAANAKATIITWDTPQTIAAGSDVNNTEGTTVFAWSCNPNLPYVAGNTYATVNGVNFSKSNPNWTIGFAQTSSVSVRHFRPSR